ncbi:MAG: sigma-70 family RNA polymerase sigma factor [Lachnospiraceae bacterium]
MSSASMRTRVEEKILDSYEGLYRLAYSYVRNEEDALDIVQESVYKAIQNAGSVKQEEYIKTWLCRIVMNTSLDTIKKRKGETSIEGIAEHGTEDTYRDFDTLQALEILNEKEKTIIILRFFEEYKLEEVANIVNENVNTVKTLLYRSLKKLKIEIAKGEADEI